MANRRGLDLKSCVIDLSNYKVRFYLPWWKKDLLQKVVLTTGSYFEEEYLYFIKKSYEEKIRNGIVLEIGANIGNHALFWALECGAKKVLAFEPMKDIYNILEENIRINSLENVIEAYNFGVGEKQGNASVAFRPADNCGGTTLKSTQEGDIEICAIDDLQIREKVNFMKIDVEGFESKVIKGALDTIRRDKPCIMVEAWDHNETIFEIINMLRVLGYDYIKWDGENYVFST